MKARPTKAPTLREFIRSSWPVIEGGNIYLHNWHIEAIADHLEAVSRGEITRLLINVPFRFMKSTLVSVMWPAWTWISDPSHQWLTGSHAMALAVRDNRKMRLLVESPWYRERWGDRFAMTSDQNQKVRFENDQRGYRLAFSMSSGVMGEGGDTVICLPYNELVTTDRGLLPIGDIVRQRLSVGVLGFDNESGLARWTAITAFEQSAGRETVRLALSNGAELSATTEHPVFIVGRGYIPAAFVRVGDRVIADDFSVSAMRQELRAATGARSSVEARTLLQPSVSRSVATWREQSFLRWRSRFAQLCSVWSAHRAETRTCRSTWPEVLLSCMQDNRADWRRQSAPQQGRSMLRDVWRGIQGLAIALQEFTADLLLTHLREHRALAVDARATESELAAWQFSGSLSSGISTSVGGGSQARRCGVSSLRCAAGAGKTASGSPHQSQRHRQLRIEPDHDLPPLPPQGARNKIRSLSLATVCAVERVETPDRVFNIRTETRNYFASGTLVHNCDDPHDREGAHSDLERATALANFDEGIVTRLNRPTTSAIVIIMQRLHEQDLSGHVLAKGGYEHLLIPMHFDPKRARTTAIGWSDPRKVSGDLAWPERFPLAVVVQLERDLGSYAAAGQLEQRPAPAEGGIIKRTWWKFFDVLPAELDEEIQSWDLAVKDTADYVAGQAWARKGSACYLRDEVYERLDFPETIAAFRSFSARYPTGAKLVEDKANGPAVIATLMHEVPGIIAINPDGNKEARARAVTPYIEAGNVFLPNPYDAAGNSRADRAWVLRFIESCAQFPNAAHDDDVDAMTQAVHRLVHGIGSDAGVLQFYQNKANDLAPKIVTISPPSGSIAGGEIVTITGKNLSGGSIEIDGVIAQLQAMSDIEIRFVAPEHRLGAVNVIVKTPAGSATSRSGYTYAAA